MRKHPNNRGFTLIELLLTIAIIGILASVVFASVTVARGKARDAKRIVEIKQIDKALVLYEGNHQSYPPTTPAGFSGSDAALQYLVSLGYLPSVPVPFAPSTGYIYYGANPGVSPTTECPTTEPCRSFVLGVTLERPESITLTKDEDVTSFTPDVGTYDGSSSNCLGGVGADLCYDIMR